MSRLKKKKMSERQIVRFMSNIVKRYGKARIIVSDGEPTCDCMCKKCRKEYGSQPNLRRRLITRDGDCYVQHKGSEYHKWSSGTQSCFMENYYENHYCEDEYCNCSEAKDFGFNPKETLEYMFNHDRNDLRPIMIEYGKRFKRKVYLK